MVFARRKHHGLFSINHHILLLDFSPSPGMDESMVTQAKATSQGFTR